VLDSGTTITGTISFPSNVNVSSGTLSTDDIVATDNGSASSGVVDATASSSTGVGVLGRGDVGVLGISTTLTGNAVEGEGPAFGNGVFGRNSNASGTALLGIAEGTSGPTFAINGQNTSPQGRGVYGFSAFASGTTYGVRGDALSPSGFGVFSTGDFGGTGAKYFIAPDPSNPAREVRFIALEGNEAGTYFRGSAEVVAGRAIIEVPEDFRLVTELEGLTVHLTPTGAWAPLWVETKGLNQIVIRSEADHLSFDFVVNGFRRGYVDTPTIAENEHYRPVYRDLPFGTQYPEGVQQILIESGVLNADLTPNEATAASLGWELRDASEAPHLRYSSREE